MELGCWFGVLFAPELVASGTYVQLCPMRNAVAASVAVRLADAQLVAVDDVIHSVRTEWWCIQAWISETISSVVDVPIFVFVSTKDAQA